MIPLDEFELKMMELDERLRPVANRPVDITSPDWVARLGQSAHPLDEAGLRPETEALLEQMIGVYRNAGDPVRQAIRTLFAKYRSLAWAASLPFAPTTEENFRRHLLLFSIKDQGRDSRDALLVLQDLCRQAAGAGVILGPLLRAVADLSSDQNKYGMGSTRQMLLRACETASA